MSCVNCTVIVRYTICTKYKNPHAHASEYLMKHSKLEILFLAKRRHPSHMWHISYLRVVFPVAYPGIFFGVVGCSTISVEGRRQRERGSGGGSPLARGPTQFVNE
jgi:hypothetical protein